MVLLGNTTAKQRSVGAIEGGIMKIEEILESSPVEGDILEFEFGDIVIETTVIDIQDSSLCVQLSSVDPKLMESINCSSWETLFTGLTEAEYRGRKVSLGKPTRGDVKKFKVYVKGPKGNVVKVNFGDPNMRIKKSNPKRRKSFRARHRCENPGPRWKARFWSCRAW
jgi:hypothetical protein